MERAGARRKQTAGLVQDSYMYVFVHSLVYVHSRMRVSVCMHVCVCMCLYCGQLVAVALSSPQLIQVTCCIVMLPWEEQEILSCD